MQVVTPTLIQNKKVLLRLDIDIPLGGSAGQYTSGSESQTSEREVIDDFRLKAALPTLKLCLESAQNVVVMGHIGRPEGKENQEFSIGPIYDWFWEIGEIREFIENGKLRFLENLRFEPGEEKCDLGYARELASFGDIFVNEAFATYHKAASTTVLPTLLPHAMGLRFAEEVSVLTRVREAPRPGLVAIIGGAKIEDKLPVVLAMSKIAEHVLVGGKMAGEMMMLTSSSAHEKPLVTPEDSLGVGLAPGSGSLPNVLIGTLNKEGTDLTEESILSWKEIIDKAKMIVWNGPVGKIESQESRVKSQGELGSAKGTYQLAHMIINSGAETIVGGGDTVGFLDKLGLLDKFSFVSTGGGAMLKFLETGTLPTIEALV